MKRQLCLINLICIHHGGCEAMRWLVKKQLKISIQWSNHREKVFFSLMFDHKMKDSLCNRSWFQQRIHVWVIRSTWQQFVNERTEKKKRKQKPHKTGCATRKRGSWIIYPHVHLCITLHTWITWKRNRSNSRKVTIYRANTNTHICGCMLCVSVYGNWSWPDAVALTWNLLYNYRLWVNTWVILIGDLFWFLFLRTVTVGSGQNGAARCIT